ncbi:YdeI/OmpD-associated family protein [Flagellimonas halotolerans]|uniref:YdeI/OmpD-associated family protein n=1 Tax=Flagellimonas halotolerans TaxID=3112164 RepID=A0ABU6IRG1_9FLAO|nr:MULTISPECIES: YdeI/OmpD-associated family protein [unclassified Allomuricauda]MEC3965846.1 YdeI/OmpD-associated family protein [Muricauda sp. SYSU M86414]MEC4265688.1 YdeI/OmpD-associated family protein [Muricauda sp. SYSU M84420]
MNNKVAKYIDNIKNWKEETILLRNICLDCGLEEDFKWMHPCYTYRGKNIVLIHGFKDYCALLFHKGALLKDTAHILVQQTENVQSARQIRFSDLQEIMDLKTAIKTYIFEAIEVEKSGLTVKKKKTSDYEMPTELEEAFKKNPQLESAFNKLTPGRQRGYLLYFSQAKQSKTRASRIDKSLPKIFEGKGHNEN